MTDAQVLDIALELVLKEGLTALTFAALSSRCGLSPATLVQRFSTKRELMHRTLQHAWDLLDTATAELTASTPRTPAGAIELLVGLSRQYDDRDAYRHGLMLLREDIGDPRLRRRGVAWEGNLVAALDARLDARGDELHARPLGGAMARYWQGVISWWAFHDDLPLTAHLTTSLEEFLEITRPRPAG